MSDDPKINMITTCWRHLRLTGSHGVPKGTSPPKLPVLISTLATMYRLEADINRYDSIDDQLTYVHNYLEINNLPRHKLTTADKHRLSAKKKEVAKLTKQERVRQKEPFMPAEPPPGMQSVPLKRLTKKQRKAERLRRKAERASRDSALKREEKHTDHYAWVISDDFLRSYEWRKIRYAVVVRCKGRCEACGAGKEQDIVLHVDHIKPRRKYPELALAPSNLQGLCGPCNHGKGNWDETDWRSEETKVRFADDWEEADSALDSRYLDALAGE